MLLQIPISEGLTPFVIIVATTIISVIGYFLKKSLNSADKALEKANRAFAEISILDIKIDARQKAIDEKLERTLSTLNDNVRELAEGIKPLALMMYRLEQLEKSVNRE